MKSMPRFDLHDYEALLASFVSAGYDFGLIAKGSPSGACGRVTYLRHDVDLHLRGVETMAHLEARRGVRATYYVPLTLHFNVLYPENRRILREIRDDGHEIGLHYDLTTYPTDAEEARRHLDWEVGVLGAAAGCEIRTVCMHNPHTGHCDPFRDLGDRVNPDSAVFRRGCLYVSDSCRAWRDDSLLRCFGDDPPQRVLLNTHPELWLLGDIVDPIEYVEAVVRKTGVQQNLEYFDYVRGVWAARAAQGSQSTSEGAVMDRRDAPC